MKVLILCGGFGTRLWPISTKSTPKQFAPLFKKYTLFQKTIIRNHQLSSLKVQEFIIVLNKNQIELAQRDIEELKESIPLLKEIVFSFHLEPLSQNTASAICLPLFQENPDEIILVVPSDHLIEQEQKYNENINEAHQLAKDDHIIVFGIHPTHPETGYGYIQTNHKEVLSFKEKPDLLTAQHYIKEKNFLWNSGMFCFKTSLFLKEFENLCPNLFKQLKSIAQKPQVQPSLFSYDENAYSSLENISIDYALIEKTKKLKVVTCTFDWSDVGSFDALYDVKEKDESLNASDNNNNQFLDAHRNLVLTQNLTVALCGVDDLIIVQSEDKLLITKIGMGQRVKEISSKF